MSREKTEEEVRTKFLHTVKSLVKYWANESSTTDVEDKCDGVAFSILALLDGCNASMPGFIVAPLPHPDDKEYHKENQENWYPENHDSNVKCDISGCLHELYYNA